MTIRLTAALCFAFLAAACGPTPTDKSGSPLAPSANPPVLTSGVNKTGDCCGGPTPIPGTSVGPGLAWKCDDDEADLCIEGGTISGNDPTCFRNWDATGHCKQYDFGAP